MKLRFFITTTILFILIVTGDIFPQSSQRITSPEIHSDRTVTFRFQAPQSHQVNVNVNGQLKAMNKDENGVWSFTSDPFDPGISQPACHGGCIFACSTDWGYYSRAWVEYPWRIDSRLSWRRDGDQYLVNERIL